MNQIEDMIRTRVDLIEQTTVADGLELSPRTRTRVRARQIVTAAFAATTVALVTLLSVVTVDHLAIPSSSHVSRPAGRAHVQHKITPLKNGETTGVLATFVMDGDTYTLEVGRETGSVELELAGASATIPINLPDPGGNASNSWQRSFTGGMVIVGLVPSNAASVRITTTDGRSSDASLYALPQTYTSDFEAYGVVMQAPPASFTVTAYDASGVVIGNSSHPIPTSPPTLHG